MPLRFVFTQRRCTSTQAFPSSWYFTGVAWSHRLGSLSDPSAECIDLHNLYTTVDVAAVQLILFSIHAYMGPTAPPGSVFVDGVRNEFELPVSVLWETDNRILNG